MPTMSSLKDPAERRLYLACIIANPIRRIWQWFEDESQSGWDEDLEWHPTHKLLFYCRVSRFLERCVVIIYLWIARNGEDWTFWRSIKATICLLFWLDHKFHSWEKGYAYNFGSEVVWWSMTPPNRFYPYPKTWNFIQVGEVWRHWWVKFDSDSAD